MKRTIIWFITVVWFFALQAQKPIQITPSELRHGPAKGSLVIIGGGNVVDEIWDSIIYLAGGAGKARFVVVSNASGDDREDYHSAAIDTLTRRLGADRVSRLHLKNIREANDENNLTELKQATGVYFSGGRQWRIADVYLNTSAHQEFFDILERGGVIAGSSAGASIQGSFLWRGDTKGAQILLGDHTQGLGFLRNSVIDQHILVRNRQADLSQFVKIAPHFIGIGIDESTAVIVRRDSLEVIGKSYVAIHNADSLPFFFLHKGEKYDLKERKIIREPRRREQTNED